MANMNQKIEASESEKALPARKIDYQSPIENPNMFLGKTRRIYSIQIGTYISLTFSLCSETTYRTY
jgi:hypothetical protein